MLTTRQRLTLQPLTAQAPHPLYTCALVSILVVTFTDKHHSTYIFFFLCVKNNSVVAVTVLGGLADEEQRQHKKKEKEKRKTHRALVLFSYRATQARIKTLHSSVPLKSGCGLSETTSYCASESFSLRLRRRRRRGPTCSCATAAAATGVWGFSMCQWARAVGTLNSTQLVCTVTYTRRVIYTYQIV